VRTLLILKNPITVMTIGAAAGRSFQGLGAGALTFGTSTGLGRNPRAGLGTIKVAIG
jgi:hypothetical protein